jgi:hypothetical protein
MRVYHVSRARETYYVGIKTNSAHDAGERLWTAASAIHRDLKTDFLKLGKVFVDLRNLYSERNSGDSRRRSGHGTFEAEIIKRGFALRRVREWIADFEATQTGKLTTAEKRKARRAAQKAAISAMKLAPALTTPQPNAPRLIFQDQREASDATHKRFFDVHLEGLSEYCDAIESANIPAVVRAYKEGDELSSALDSIANVMLRLRNLSFSLRAAAETGLVIVMPPVNTVSELAAAA